MTDETFTPAIYQPEMVSVDKDGLIDLIAICEENTKELLADHLRNFGETTKLSKATASFYRSQLEKCEQIRKAIT